MPSRARTGRELGLSAEQAATLPNFMRRHVEQWTADNGFFISFWFDDGRISCNDYSTAEGWRYIEIRKGEQDGECNPYGEVKVKKESFKCVYESLVDYEDEGFNYLMMLKDWFEVLLIWSAHRIWARFRARTDTEKHEIRTFCVKLYCHVALMRGIIKLRIIDL